MPSLTNKALTRLRAGEPALGIITRHAARSGDIAYVAKTCDHDFLFIDMQHGSISIETAVDLCLVALGVGVAPIVRISGPDNTEAARLLDSGAQGIIVPGVGTAEEARRAVMTCKFPPLGRRSVGAGYPQLGFATVPIGEATQTLNDNTLLVCMIETREGMDNLEAIAEVDGVDVLLLGCNDLLTEIGLPGQFGHPRIMEVVDRLLAACKANGKYAGFGGDKDPERQADFLRRGGQFIATHSDLWYLMNGAGQRAAFLREAVKRPAAS